MAASTWHASFSLRRGSLPFHFCPCNDQDIVPNSLFSQGPHPLSGGSVTHIQVAYGMTSGIRGYFHRGVSSGPDSLIKWGPQDIIHSDHYPQSHPLPTNYLCSESRTSGNRRTDHRLILQPLGHQMLCHLWEKSEAGKQEATRIILSQSISGSHNLQSPPPISLPKGRFNDLNQVVSPACLRHLSTWAPKAIQK